MEKLIELLNEYETKTVVHWYEWYWQDVLMCRYIKDNFEFYTDEAATIAISKYYWFAERLVKNNKIDISKLWKKSNMWFGDKYTREETLLMLLSISDTPIKDLISYLK